MALGGSGGTGGASSSAIKAGEAFYELSADDKKLLDSLNRAVQRVKKLGATFKAIGVASIGIGVAIALPIGKAAQSFADFDDKMRVVKAVTEGTSEQFDRLTELAKELGKTTSFSATSVADLMGELGKAGFSRDEIEQTTASVLNLARASGTDAKLSAEILGSTLRQFGLDASKAAHVADLLAVTANQSAVSVEDLGESLKFAGPVAADLGLSVEKTLALLGVLGNLGIKGTEAGSAIRRLGVISAAQGDKFKELFNIDTKGKNLIEILSELGKVTKNLDPQERAKKFADLFGLLGITGASSLSKSTKSIDEFIEALSKADGEAERTAKEMDGGLGGGIRRVKAAFESLVITVGEAASPVLMEFGKNIIEVLSSLTNIVKNNKEIIGVLATLAVSLVAVGVPLAGFGLMITGIISGIIALKTAIVAIVGIALSPLAIKIAIVVAALTAFSYALSVIAGTDSEIIPTLERIAGLFGDIFKGVIAALKKGDLKLAGDIILVGFGVIMAELELFLTKSWVGIKKVFVDVFYDIIYLLRLAWNDFTTWLGVTVFEAVEKVASVIHSLITTLNKTLPDKLKIPLFDLNEFKAVTAEIIDDQHAAGAIANERINRDRKRQQDEADAARAGQIKAAENQVELFKKIFNGLLREAFAQPPEVAPMPREKKKEEAKVAAEPMLEGLSKAVKGAFTSADFRGVFALNESNKEMKEQGKTLKGIKNGVDAVEETLKNGLAPAEFK